MMSLSLCVCVGGGGTCVCVYDIVITVISEIMEYIFGREIKYYTGIKLKVSTFINASPIQSY